MLVSIFPHYHSRSSSSYYLAVLAFSAGARSCIGMRFAYAESVCILANLVRLFEILPARCKKRGAFASFEDMKRYMLKTWPEITTKPVNGFVSLRPLSFVAREA